MNIDQRLFLPGILSDIRSYDIADRADRERSGQRLHDFIIMIIRKAHIQF